MEKSLRDKIKAILGMPVEKIEDVVSETTEATEATEQTQEATEVAIEMAEEKPATDETPVSTEAVETVEMATEYVMPIEVETSNPSTDQTTNAIAELQREVDYLKEAIKELVGNHESYNYQQEKIKEAIELIADQPSGIAPKKTESLFSKNTATTKSNDERAKGLLKLFEVR